MKVLVIGYGSMGRRRIRLLEKLYLDIVVTCVDSNPERIAQVEREGKKGYQSLEEALKDKYDCAFICTSPGCHADIILKLINKGINTFTEINLVDDKYNEIIEVAKKNKVKVFMSSTMIYNKQIQSIQNIISTTSKTLNYIYHIGQYLPDWHPWESYKNYFVSNKSTNGCREILAIQLPWLYKTFGEIETCIDMRKKSTDLDIEYEDTYYLQIKHKNGCFGSFICDVVSRNATTYLEVFNEDIHIKWNGTPDTLFSFNNKTKEMELIPSYNSSVHIDGYSDNIIEDEYEDEMKAFFSWIEKGIKPLYVLEDDKYIISIINKVEREAK